jgi:spore coat protein CotH
LLILSLLAGCSSPSCGFGEADLPFEGAAIAFQHEALPEFNISMTDEALAALPQSVDDPRGPNQHATINYQQDTFDVGLKLKGTSTFRSIDEKPSFKLDFEEWSDEKDFYGLRRLTLNNMVQNPSKISEAIAYTLYEWMDVIAPRHGYACVSVNDEPYGLYSVVETMDEQFIDHNFSDDDGNLYEGTYGADLGGTHPELFTLEEENEDNHDALWALSKEVDDVDGAWLDLLDRNFDLDALLRSWAIEIATANPDGYAIANNNFLLYHEPSTERWTMIPWSTDLAMMAVIDPGAPSTLTSGALFAGCLSQQDCHNALNDTLHEVADVMEDNGLADYADELVDLVADVTRADERDEQNHLQVAWAQWINQNFLHRRPDEIRDALDD